MAPSRAARISKAEAQARAFCHAIAEETAGMEYGTWRMLATIARRLGLGFDAAEAIARDCVRRQWVDYDAWSVRLREGGRLAARDVRRRARAR